MHILRWSLAIAAVLAVILLGAAAYWLFFQPPAPKDEAMRAGRGPETLKAATEDYFHDMDGGASFTPAEIEGRNTWLVWSGGNDRFWDVMTEKTFGAFDLLKIVTSDPNQQLNRDDRWDLLGVMNEPCFSRPTGPDPERFNLWLDVRDPACPPDPFADETKYPGVAIGARGKTVPLGSYFGAPTGIVGLRLFPNPAFDKAAADRWDAVRYYTDPTYYNDRNLVRPYRVGMACSFCHVGPSPVNPPADPANPQWANISSTVGAQYMWVDRLFVLAANPDNFMYQIVKTYRPGSMDTSLVSTDNINNPRTMNAVYELGARMHKALALGKETLQDGELENRQLNDFVPDGPLTAFFNAPDTVFTPRVLKDGSDSVGVLGALNRVYLNIGLYSEEWLSHFNAVVGGKPTTPIRIATAKQNSSYWLATEQATPNLALFMLKAGRPDRLKDAPGGAALLAADDPALVERGKVVFAETCARCHSSKAPELPADLDFATCNGANYRDCFARYWSWTQSDDFKRQMTAIVQQPDFLDGNYLSTDMRIPVTLLRTNACSPLATNALAGNIWNDFSSSSYKSLPSVGSITVRNPFTGEPRVYQMPAGGRGYTRPPSLISLWASAPYLLNNAVGPFNQDPSVEGRMEMFEAGIRQMLWPETRELDAELGDKGVMHIDRTTARSSIHIPAGFIPEQLRWLSGPLKFFLPLLSEGDDLNLGPIPEGVPVNLLAAIQPLPEAQSLGDNTKHVDQVISLLLGLKADLLTLPANATDAELWDPLESTCRHASLSIL